MTLIKFHRLRRNKSAETHTHTYTRKHEIHLQNKLNKPQLKQTDQKQTNQTNKQANKSVNKPKNPQT